jgi:hypothetical protein
VQGVALLGGKSQVHRGFLVRCASVSIGAL